MKISTLSRLTAALAMASLCACAQTAEDGSPDDAPQSLREVQIPEDFTFATSHSVALTLAADASILSEGHGALEVARADGSVLFRGPMAAGAEMNIKVAVPTKDSALNVKLNANGRELVGQATIADGQASYSFQ